MIAPRHRESERSRPSPIRLPGASLKGMLRSLWMDLPIGFLVLTAWGTFNLALKNLDPPQPQIAWPVVFPLGWAAVTLWLCNGPARVLRLVKIAAALSAPLLLIALLPRQPLTAAQIKPWYEFGTLGAVALLALHCAETRPRGDLILFFGVGMLLGLILENGGIVMGFFREQGYLLHPPGLPGPLATGMGWTAVFYSSMHVAEHLLFVRPRPSAEEITPRPGRERSVWWGAALATAVGITFDLLLDPTATAAGAWTWDSSLASFPMLLGVPLINFIAWFGALAPLFAVIWWVRWQGWSSPRENLVILMALAPLLVFEVALVQLLSLLLTGGLDSPTLILFQRAMGSVGQITTAVAAVGIAIWALRIHWQARRHVHALHVAEALMMARCADVLRHCSEGGIAESDLRHALQIPLGDEVDSHQAFDEILGHCVMSGWVERTPSQPDLLRATPRGAEVAERANHAISTR
jgi:Carotenoid biosynthesis protein